jgi:hypothetical protein
MMNVSFEVWWPDDIVLMKMEKELSSRSAASTGEVATRGFDVVHFLRSLEPIGD